jgi:hypothetical protein
VRASRARIVVFVFQQVQPDSERGRNDVRAALRNVERVPTRAQWNALPATSPAIAPSPANPFVRSERDSSQMPFLPRWPRRGCGAAASLISRTFPYRWVDGGRVSGDGASVLVRADRLAWMPQRSPMLLCFADPGLE